MTCRATLARRPAAELLRLDVGLDLVARVAAARDAVVVGAPEPVELAAPAGGFWPRLRRLLGLAPAELVFAVLPGPREILRVGDVWYCAPATAAELNALMRR